MSKPIQCLKLAAVGMVSSLVLAGCGEESPAEATMRNYFSIPPEIAFASSYSPTRLGKGGYTTKGVIEFSPAEFEAYLDFVTDRYAWEGRPIDPAIAPGGVKASPSAQQWKRADLADDATTEKTTGLKLCNVVRETEQERVDPSEVERLEKVKASMQRDWERRDRQTGRPPPRSPDSFKILTSNDLSEFSIVACDDLGQAERPRLTIEGTLNPETRTLQINMH